MAVRIDNVGKWQVIPVGQPLPLPGGQLRTIRVTFNCPAPTRFDLVEDGTMTFLAVIEGLETVEFVAGDGKEVVIQWDGEVAPWFYTRDGAVTAIRYGEPPVKFTKLATRRQRNPDLARIEDMIRLNEIRRDQKQAEERRRHDAEVRRLRERAEAAEKKANGDSAAGEDKGRVAGVGASAAPEPAEPAADAGAAGGAPEGGTAVPAAKKAKGEVDAGTDA